MKKLFIASFVLVLFTVTFSSCKKDYTCTCDDGSGGKVSVTLHATKKDAKAACETTANCKID